jgi:hypothetical protein
MDEIELLRDWCQTVVWDKVFYNKRKELNERLDWIIFNYYYFNEEYRKEIYKKLKNAYKENDRSPSKLNWELYGIQNGILCRRENDEKRGIFHS